MTDLTGYTTRWLLMKKNSAYFDEYERMVFGAGPLDPSYEEIIAELNTREHIPNKIEAKKIRQERAKKGSRKNHKKS